MAAPEQECVCQGMLGAAQPLRARSVMAAKRGRVGRWRLGEALIGPGARCAMAACPLAEGITHSTRPLAAVASRWHRSVQHSACHACEWRDRSGEGSGRAWSSWFLAGLAHRVVHKEHRSVRRPVLAAPGTLLAKPLLSHGKHTQIEWGQRTTLTSRARRSLLYVASLVPHPHPPPTHRRRPPRSPAPSSPTTPPSRPLTPRPPTPSRCLPLASSSTPMFRSFFLPPPTPFAPS